MTVRVLIVDDSRFIRRRIADILADDDGISVIGFAENGRDAVAKARLLKPDVITMDVEMPVLDGIAAVKHIMASNPTAILMFSALTKKGAQETLDALDAGAMDFLPKQLDEISNDRSLAETLLRRRVRVLGNESQRKKRLRSSSASGRQNNKTANNGAGTEKVSSDVFSLAVIAASTGGPIAVRKLVASLPANFALPIVVIQHMPATFTQSFAERLNRHCDIEVRLAKSGDRLTAGVALLAPGGSQLELQGSTSNPMVVVRPSRGDENFSPSADTTFSSISRNLAARTLAIVLTGMGSDGKAGAEKLKANGSSVWAQTEESCTVYGMPKAIVEANLADNIMDPTSMGVALRGF